MKYLLFFLLCSSVIAQDRYKAITDRNAFALLDEVPTRTTPPPIIVQSPIKLNLTGIISRRGVTNVYLFTKDVPKRFLTLSTLRRTDSGVTLLSVDKGLVEVNNNGVIELLSFDTHKLPSVITLPALKATPTVVTKKDSKGKDVKIKPASPKPNVVTVPSRGRITDPRMQSMMERGLEYLNKIDDPKKKEAMVERLEKFQRGDYDKEIKDRMKQYEEYRKSKDRKK